MRNKKGFTFVNLLVITAVIGILVGISVPAVFVPKKDAAKEKPEMHYSIMSTDERAFSGAIAAHAAGDVNGDGFADLVIGDAKTLRLYLNDGVGKFNEPRLITELTNIITAGGYAADLRLSVSLSDIGNDKDLDLIVGDKKGIAILYNDGEGNFSQ